jgi:hypothetical protein
MTGSVTFKKACRRGAQIERRLLDRAVEPGKARGQQAHGPGDRDHDVREHQPGARAQERQLGRDLDLDLEHVDGRAGDDAGHHQRQDQQRVQRFASGELAARQHQARGHAEDEPPDHRHADLQAG